jgi:hypothetical protein
MYDCHILEHEDNGMMGQFVTAQRHSARDGSCGSGSLESLKWILLSGRSFRANAVRIQLHSLAYILGNFLRALALHRWVASNPGRPWPMVWQRAAAFTAFQIAAGSQMATLALGTQTAWGIG